MLNGIIGKKLGMTRIFDEDGTVVPVTVIEAGPCYVVQKKTADTDGYEAVQLGFARKALVPGRLRDLAVGDFNNDGRPDLALGNPRESANVRVFLGNGEGTFRNGLNFTVDDGPEAVAVGDFNNDGTPDRAGFRASTWNNWIIDYGMNGVDTRNHYGAAGDIPVVGDFNADGMTDRAVFRKGEWIIDYNMDGSIDARPRIGQAGDIPLVWNL